ncbi:MAG: fibronectin type III domain-containing protein, partial [Candidatus Thermoplasmatota archaeon]|nr:fibronectin type III domain-containing protein [Candidatus Thermoplasmatota archaeon]
MNKFTRLFLTAVIASIFLFPLPFSPMEMASSQSVPFALVGTIYDVDGATPLAEATVTVTNNETGMYATTLSDLQGNYVVDMNTFPGGTKDGVLLIVYVSKDTRVGSNSTFLDRSTPPFNRCDVFTRSDIPVIMHSPVADAAQGQTFRLEATILDDVAILGAEVTLWNNRTPPETFAMEQNGHGWALDLMLSGIPGELGWSLWPSFFYNISATDGKYEVVSGPHPVSLEDTIPPELWCLSQGNQYPEGQDLEVFVEFEDNHGVIGAFIEYDGMEHDMEFVNPTMGRHVIPGQKVQMPSITFEVTAWDTANNATETWTLQVYDNTPPTAVTNFSASTNNGTVNVTLQWEAATDNVAVTGYTMQRWRTGGTEGSITFSISGSALTFTDSTCLPNTNYTYRISARDQRGNLGPPAALSITTLDIDPPVIEKQMIYFRDEGIEIRVNATITDDSPVTANLHYDSIKHSGKVMMETTDGVNWSGVIPAEHVKPGLLEYYVSASDGTYWSQTYPSSISITDTTPPSMVSMWGSVNTASAEPYIEISWTPAIDNVAVERYEIVVQNRSFSQPPTTAQYTIQETSFDYEGLEPNETYHFAVAARDASGNRANWSYIDVSVGEWAVDRTPPTITHSPLVSAKAGQSLTIEAFITDQSGVAKAEIYYWNHQGAYSIQMYNPSVQTWKATIPFSRVVGANISYYIAAEDVRGYASQSGDQSHPHIINLISRKIIMNHTSTLELRMSPG